VYVDGVCIDRDETFWKKNVISVNSTLVIDGKSISTPIFSGTATKTNCRIAVANFGVLASIPARGTEVKLGASILRFDNKDTIKRVLSGINSSTSDAVLKTYAVSAIPYITLVGTIGNELYKDLGPDPNGEVLLQFSGLTIEPNADSANPFRLRDMVVLQYFGTESLDQTKLQEKNGDVYYNGQPLRSGAWITFRIEKHTNRVDFFGRGWYTKFSSAIQELTAPSPNLQTVEKDYNDGAVLLFSDGDFTPVDQNAILTKTKQNIDNAEALLKLGKGDDVKNAVESSTVPVQAVGTAEVTLAPRQSTMHITQSAALGLKPVSPGLKAIEPGALSLALQKIAVEPRQ
jgi:hypothetical protein